MNPFKDAIIDHICQALDHKYGSEVPYDKDALKLLIEAPPNPEMGDYAFPCFHFAKPLRKAPPVISQELLEVLIPQLESSVALESVKAVGPYLNFYISSSYMASMTLPKILDGSWFSKNQERATERVMIEYSQPNTHKGFHVGHLRNVALGDSLRRIYAYNGYNVVAANYIGDVGTHIAKCLWYYLNHNEESAPDTKRGEWLGSLYTQATQMLEDASEEKLAAYKQEIGHILQKLEAKEPEILAIWDETRQWSLDEFEEIYQWLNNHFDHVFYESDVDEEGRNIVETELEKETFVRSQGAIGIDLEDAGLGFFLLLKSDGSTLYSTKDLALAQKKFDTFEIQKSIYVVGAEQTLHFKQVFETLKRMGYKQAEDCFHLSYGLVVLPSGKMSSRAGNVILFSQLRDEMTNYIHQQYLVHHEGEWSETEIQSTNRKIAIAAIKYGMLSQDPSKQIVFSMEDWLSSEGDTGTYLIYAYARIRSIGRQLESVASADADISLLVHPNEKVLIRRLFDFNEVVWKAGEQYKPSMLARFLYETAKDFSRAYQTCSVRYAETSELREARQLLFHGVAEVLGQGLELLGITAPERM